MGEPFGLQFMAQLLPAQAASQAARLARPMTPDEFAVFARSLFSVSAAIEMAVLAACLGLAYGIAHLLSGRWRGAKSVLFGERIVDGALFPVLALLLALLARFTVLADVPVAVMRVAIAMLLALALIRLFVRVLQAAFPTSEFVRIAERWLSWAVWIGLLLWITGVLPILAAELDAISWKVGTGRISLRSLLEGAFNAVVVLMVALWISAAIEARLLKGQATGEITNVSVRKMAANATRAMLLLVGMLLALSAAGIDLTALSVLGGAIGVGLGFGLQKLASNYVSGFVILAEGSLNIGDLVKVDGFEGRITDINTRSTRVRAPSGRESIVPNELLITQRVENASSIDPASQESTQVRVAYGTDVTALQAVLMQTLLGIERVMKDAAHAPAVYLSNFAPDGLELTLWYWNGDPGNGSNNLRSEVNLAVLAALDAQGVLIPLPQRVLHGLPGQEPLAPAPANSAGP